MRNEIGSFSARFAFLRGTFFHPQWFAHRHENSLFAFIGTQSGTRVLDVGCSDQRIKQFLSGDREYTGFDYYSTATQWYETRPTIYGDAHALPFPDAQFETVLLLDVLEHLQAPEVCVKEIGRVLKNGGNLFLKVPFLYPIHDVRWTSTDGLVSVSFNSHIGKAFRSSANATLVNL